MDCQGSATCHLRSFHGGWLGAAAGEQEYHASDAGAPAGVQPLGVFFGITDMRKRDAWHLYIYNYIYTIYIYTCYIYMHLLNKV